MARTNSQFKIRHYLPETDLSSLARLLTETEAFDRDGEDTSEEYLRSALGWPNFRPAQDAWVAESGGTLIGYGVALEQPSQRCTLYVVVHPSQRRKGLGSQFLELALARAREVGSKTILVYANEHSQAANSFLKVRSFSAVGTSGVMLAPATLEIPAFEFPSGFTLKQFSEVNDPYFLAVALIDCYLGMWGHQHSEKALAENPRVLRFLGYYGAKNIFLLFDAENVVSGICSLKPEDRTDENGNVLDLLDGPGVIQKYREAGYQRQLVLASIRRLRERGQRPIKLEFFGDDEKTINIYRELGFEMQQQYLAYHKELA
jgi:GNAT superfamily N-acetyltransferase